MFRKLPLVSLFALMAQAQVHVPQVGSIRCVDGSVRPVYGVPASFVLGKPLLFSATSSSFSEAGGIVATSGAVHLLNVDGKPIGEFATAETRPLVNIDSDVSSATAWLPETNSLLYWDGSSFQQVVLPSPLSGRVTGLRRDGGRAVLLVFENGGVSETAISLSSGNTLSEVLLPSVNGPAFREGEFILFPSETGLEIEGPEGRRSLAVAAASDLSIERLSTQWLHLSSAASGHHWALHITNGTLQLLELPAVPRAEIAK
jgi:hypothetical protein